MLLVSQRSRYSLYILFLYVSDDKMPVVTRLTLLSMCFLVYILIKFKSMEDGVLLRYVSWNEFIHNMLAKGEVGTVCLFMLI